MSLATEQAVFIISRAHVTYFLNSIHGGVCLTEDDVLNVFGLILVKARVLVQNE